MSVVAFFLLLYDEYMSTYSDAYASCHCILYTYVYVLTAYVGISLFVEVGVRCGGCSWWWWLLLLHAYHGQCTQQQQKYSKIFYAMRRSPYTHAADVVISIDIFFLIKGLRQLRDDDVIANKRGTKITITATMGASCTYTKEKIAANMNENITQHFFFLFL